MKGCMDVKYMVRITLSVLLLILLDGLSAACSSFVPTTTLPTATSQPLSSPTATSEPALAPIPTNTVPKEAGWKEVLHLGNDAGTVTQQGGAVEVRQPYQIFVVCEGSDSLEVTFAPQGKGTFICTAGSTLQEDYIGTEQTSSQPETINVTVTTTGSVLWEVSIQVQQ